MLFSARVGGIGPSSSSAECFPSYTGLHKVLGWREVEYARDMQLHYEESSVQKRFLEALVTWDV